MSDSADGVDPKRAYADKLHAVGLQRARDVVAKIPAEPGWRACVVLIGAKLDKERHEVALSLVSITHWGVMRPTRTFGQFSGIGSLSGGLMGGGADAPVPMDAAGAVLNGEGFWGLVAPHETSEEIAAKFEAEVDAMNAKQAEWASARAAKANR